MKVVAPYTEFRTAGLFRSTAVSTGLALKCEVVCQGYLYARNILHSEKAQFGVIKLQKIRLSTVAVLVA